MRRRFRRAAGRMVASAAILTFLHTSAEPIASADTTSPAAETQRKIQGRWAKLTHLETLTKLPIIGEVAQETDVVSLVELRANGRGELMYREKTCRLTSKTLAGLIETSYPPSFLRVLAKDWQPARLVSVGEDVVFEQPHGVRRYGFVGEDVPQSKDDARVRDSDRDGYPGVTIKTEGLVGGEIYAAVEEWSEVRGRVLSPSHVEGRVKWGTDFTVLDASNRLLSSQPKTRIRPEPEAHHFVMRRVPSRANCRALLTRLDQVFAEN